MCGMTDRSAQSVNALRLALLKSQVVSETTTLVLNKAKPCGHNLSGYNLEAC